jgi:CHASE1-domain containing sensor protein
MQKARKLRSLSVHLIFLGLGIGAVILVLALLWWDVAMQPAVQSNFSYSADTVASETEYDPASNKPVSTLYTQATLQLTSFGSGTDQHVKSAYSEIAATGEKIATIERTLPVNAQNGYYTDTNPHAYVLAPRSTQKNSSFTYYHAAYDTPIKMTYDKDDSLQGLVLYRFKSSPESSISQRIGDKDVKIAPDLTIWIEPVTGWVVQYHDTSLTYSAQHPDQIISKLDERTTTESARQHVAYASVQKSRLLFAKQAAPSLILAILIVVILAAAIIRMPKTTVSIYGITSLVVATGCAVLAGWILSARPLITLFTESSAVNPLTAVCFILTALAIVALYKDRRIAVAFAGGIVTILAMMQLLGSLGSLPFSVDLLFFKDAVLEVGEQLPSRMSTYAAFTFLALGIVLVKAGFTTRNSEIHFAKFIAGVAMTLGLFGALIKLSQIDQVFTLTFVSSLHFIIPLLFIACSFTLMQLFRTIHNKSDDVRSTLRSLKWPALATAPLIVIGIFAQLQQNAITQSLETTFGEKTQAFETELQSRTAIFANTLTGTSALFASSQEVTHDEFQKYVAAFGDTTGTSGVGYAALTGIQTASIQYLEPRSTENDAKKGTDLFADPVIAQALIRARDSGKTILAGPTTLLAPTQTVIKQSFLVTPVYLGSATSITERRERIAGYVFAILPSTMLVADETKRLDGIDFAAYDGLTTTDSTLLYSDISSFPYTPRLSKDTTLFVANRPITIAYNARPDFRLSTQEEFSPTLILVGGSLAYFALITVLYFLSDLERRNRITREVKRRLER